MCPYSTQNVYSYLFTQYDYQYHGFSPQVPSFTFAFKGSPSPPVHSQVKELPTDSDMKPSTPLPAKTFTCKDPEEGKAFPVSLMSSTRCIGADVEAQSYTLASDYQSDDADYTIWSSDVIGFKVHSYRLQAASHVTALMRPWLMLKAILSSVVERGENCNDPQLIGIRISWRFSRGEPLGHHLHFGTDRVPEYRARIPGHHIGYRVGMWGGIEDPEKGSGDSSSH